MECKTILVVNEKNYKTNELSSIIKNKIGYSTHIVSNESELKVLLPNKNIKLIILLSDLNLCSKYKNMLKFCYIPKLLLLNNHDKSDVSPEMFLKDFDDFIIAPFDELELECRVRHFIEAFNNKQTIKKNLLQKLGMYNLIGHDPAFEKAVSKIPIIAKYNASVLITGETGTGKGVCARAIHYLSDRANKPFITVECGSIPSNLLENELFGHKEGAYTDARQCQAGLISKAEGGTLFLDEIDSMNLEAQSKLLRLIEEKKYRPLGSTVDKTANVRIIAATNANLMECVNEGHFRKDLFYRIKIPLVLPSLKDRKTDIPLLANFFLSKLNKQNERGIKNISNSALQKLMGYDWPGNVRELDNVIQTAYLFTKNSLILPDEISFQDESKGDIIPNLAYREAKQKAIDEFEKSYISRLLLKYHGNISKAAKEARKDRSDFGRLVKKHELSSRLFAIFQSNEVYTEQFQI